MYHIEFVFERPYFGSSNEITWKEDRRLTLLLNAVPIPGTQIDLDGEIWRIMDVTLNARAGSYIVTLRLPIIENA